MSGRTRSRLSTTEVLLWTLAGLLFLIFITLAVVLIVRSRVLDPRVELLGAEQLKLVWAFIGACLASLVTAVGAILTAQNNRRTAAAVKEAADREHDLNERRIVAEETARAEQGLADRRKELLEREASDRQTVDTVVKVAQLVTKEAGYAHPTSVSTALMTLIALGQDKIAVFLLEQCCGANAVTPSGAAAIIDQLLRREDAEVSQSATFVLLRHAADLAGPEHGLRGAHAWPDSLAEGIPDHLPEDARWHVLLAAALMLMTRDVAWWAHASIYTFYNLALHELNSTNPAARQREAFLILHILARCGPLLPDATWAVDELTEHFGSRSFETELAHATPFTREVCTDLITWVETGRARTRSPDTVIGTFS